MNIGLKRLKKGSVRKNPPLHKAAMQEAVLAYREYVRNKPRTLEKMTARLRKFEGTVAAAENWIPRLVRNDFSRIMLASLEGDFLSRFVVRTNSDAPYEIRYGLKSNYDRNQALQHYFSRFRNKQKGLEDFSMQLNAAKEMVKNMGANLHGLNITSKALAMFPYVSESVRETILDELTALELQFRKLSAEARHMAQGFARKTI